MTQIEIVDLLKESGVWDEIGYPTCIDNLIDLVSAHEREKQAKQEPYACEIDLITEGVDKVGYPLLTSDKTAIERLSGNKNYSLKPLYSAPVRTKDLTNDEIYKLADDVDWAAGAYLGFARAVIAADREKNK